MTVQTRCSSHDATAMKVASANEQTAIQEFEKSGSNMNMNAVHMSNANDGSRNFNIDNNDNSYSNSSQWRKDASQLPREIRNLLAGGIAGMVAKSVVAPFDRIKILYQISSAEFHIHKVPAVAWRIIQEEGVAALWKGNTATMIRVFPYSGIQFMVFDRCKTFLLREQELEYRRRKAIDPNTPKPKWGLTATQSLFAGMIAGGLSVVATYPLDLTRAQLAVLRKKKSSTNVGFVNVIYNNYASRVSYRGERNEQPTKQKQKFSANETKNFKNSYHLTLCYFESVAFSPFFGSFIFFILQGCDWTISRDYTNNSWNIAIFWISICIQ